MRLESPIGSAASPPATRDSSTRVSLATWARMRVEVTAAVKLATNVLGPFEPLYWLLLGPPISAGAATVAVAWYLAGALSTSAATAPPAISGTSTRIHTRRRMIRR